MRLPTGAALDLDDHPNQKKRQTSNPEETDEELYVGEDGLISVSPVDGKSQLDKLKLLLDRREQELRQAAEYGLGLLEANEELQMEVGTLKIQLETETEELSVERDMWQRRTEHAQQETAQWKRKFARVEDEKTDLAEEFEQFVDRCECRGPDTGAATATSNGRRYSHHLDTIAQLQTELQKLQAAERSNGAELTSLRQWKQVAEQQQQEALECEALAAQSEVSYRKKMEADRAATQRAMNELKNEKDLLRKAAQEYEEEMKALKKHLRLAEEARDDAQVHSNELSEKLLSSESRCKRLQRELELLEHVSYFSQAIVDNDDEESDSDDEIIDEKDLKTVVVYDKPSFDTKTAESDAENPAMPSPLRIKRRRSFLVATAVPYSPFPTSIMAEDGTQVKVSESEMETHKKLHHYFHLTALSIINENNLHDRCFNSSSRLTIDMWYREIVAKEIPFLMWHSWLINRISEVAASVQDEDKVPQPPTCTSKNSSFGAFHGFSLRKSSGSGENKAKNSLPSPPTASPAASPVARVPFTVARAFFRLLRKRTHSGADSSPVHGSPVGGSPVG
ncbi:hypothetical protein PC129_g3208 [Phytophthora cactorum]|uniref:Uncharacterized protein n=1 Tax=Phytophthora cactorum TaxID=29920 RepID=A0A329SPC2_9STRA|nr:hypothetical protein GQ600_59 [Phytophthora cactorum]KAG2764493.1 hypothetical protein Pcac1_g23910 [Phytophthora cactorum]KAG2847087.1 hypothetical protein PC111_g918 [Phytophthora cactorum]KAG2867108.1 hypothetical protein PC113_g2269 [Phytophthora cactorum]KAG2933428.1 hypothetical protein PC114_g1429 [Phytophthora cactorum]